MNTIESSTYSLFIYRNLLKSSYNNLVSSTPRLSLILNPYSTLLGNTPVEVFLELFKLPYR